MVTYTAAATVAAFALASIAMPQVSVEAVSMPLKDCGMFDKVAPTYAVIKVGNNRILLGPEEWTPLSGNNNICINDATDSAQTFKMKCCLKSMDCLTTPFSNPKPWGTTKLAGFPCNVYKLEQDNKQNKKQ